MAAELFDEIELRDLREFAKMFRPNPSRTTFESILGNLPLPIPINPLSLAMASRDVKKARKAADTFGWLYFLFDLTSTA